MFRRFMTIGTALATGLSLVVLPVVPAAAHGSSWRVIASGLDSPRGLGFAPNGTLYVAEAGVGGSGPCIPHPLGQICYGATGAVTQVKRGHQTRVLSGLPSFALQGTDEVFGPSDVGVRGKLYVTLGLGDDPSLRSQLPPNGQLAATLIRTKSPKGFKVVADIGAYELAVNPDGGLPDTNPQGLLVTKHGEVIADAGGNSLLGVSPKGRISTLAVFPNRLVPNPTPGQPDIPMQAVPTTVTRGPDGALYVGQLTGFPFPVGGANVYRIGRDGKVRVFASGFTNIIDIAFGPDRSLYVLEIAKNGLLSNDQTGALIKVGKHGKRTLIASKGLTHPTGVALRNGKAYVSNCGTCAGKGQVIAIPLH
jgi:hypothetical protein